MKRVVIRIEEEIHREIKALAAREGITMMEYIERLLREGMRVYGKKV